MKKNISRGFTLIELLIVVAIIAILAAIAVPNFLEAQTRSKVSRTRADMRTTVTALESYFVDNNRYPPMADTKNGLNPTPTGNGFHARVPSYLTTPIAYMTSITFDPFVPNTSTFSSGSYPVETRVGERYVYYNTVPLAEAYPSPWGNAELPNWVGAWLMYGYGPDQTPFAGAGATLLPYDPSNGTVSPGNIVRTQKNNESTPVNPLTGTFNF